MIHECKIGRCKDNESSKCNKKFPKPYREYTDANIDGFPLYRRRNKAIVHKGHVFDNKFVVAYNSTLMKIFRAHINVEICMSIDSIKYLAEYIVKGPSLAQIEVRERRQRENGTFDVDEIQDYVDGWYIGPAEACWDIQVSDNNLFCIILTFFKGSETHGMSHKVLQLAIHLPKQQTLFFRENEAETRLRQESAKHTMLTAWFDLNANDDFAKTIDYQDIPCHYTWQPATKVWKRRIYRNLGDNTIGRIYSASPMQVELYHL
jgi:hypothetical protein